MRKNTIRNKIFRTKRNRSDDASMAKMIIGIGGVVAAAALCYGAVKVYGALRNEYLKDCEITDVATQVTIETGAYVKRGVILDGFGLKKGENLAEINFDERRRELLAKVPNIREITVTRIQPDRVIINVQEREAVARVNLKGKKQPSGKVVDSDGIVFLRMAGTGMLPTIRESHTPGVKAGEKLPPRAFAALKLLETAAKPEFQNLGIVEVDTSPADYLVAQLGNYQIVKILWDGMDEAPSPSSQADLETRLTNLRNTINSKVTTRALVWNATERDRIFADTKEPIL